MCKGYYTKLQNVLMGFIHISYKLLKETVGKSFLNRRCVQFQVLKSSVKKKWVNFYTCRRTQSHLTSPCSLTPFPLVMIMCLLIYFCVWCEQHSHTYLGFEQFVKTQLDFPTRTLEKTLHLSIKIIQYNDNFHYL